MFKWLFNFLILFFLCFFSISFFPNVVFLKEINFVLIFILFLAMARIPGFISFAMIGGYFLDIYAAHTFGIHILTLTVCAFLVYHIYNNLITNHRFFPAIILVNFIIIVYHLLLVLIFYIFGILKFSSGHFNAGINFVDILKEIMATTFLITIVYSCIYWVQKKSKNTFLLFKFKS